MNYAFALSALLIGCAAIVAASKGPGWGWFLFFGILIAPIIHWSPL